MGSGHFLVTVVDEITRWIMSIIERNPDAPLAKEIGEDRERIIKEQSLLGIELDTDLLTFNVILKRMVMERCAFGVDINPLAVELGKVSLWLDSFTIALSLTFLDNHIRAGDSLIGLWIDVFNLKKANNLTLDAWTAGVERIGTVLSQSTFPADLTIEEVKNSKLNYDEFKEMVKPVEEILNFKSWQQ